MPDNSLGAPLVRKKTKRVIERTPFRPQSVIPGVKHTVEGAPKYSSVTSMLNQPRNMDYLSEQAQDHLRTQGKYNEVSRGVKKDETFTTAMNLFNKQQEARQRIKPIADPEAGKADRRRKAARRRMRGRLGTMLSNRETLG